MPKPLLGMKFTGKNLRVFQKASEHIRALERQLVKAAKKVIRDIASEARDGLRRSIQQGRPEWTPLSPVTVQVRRRTRGIFQKRPWRETGHLSRQIRAITRSPSADRQDAFVGIRPGQFGSAATRANRKKKQPLRLEEIVRFNEFGRRPIEVTKPMARFFRNLTRAGSPRPGRDVLRSIGPGAGPLEVPRRPLFGPYFQENKERFKKKYADALNAVVKGAARKIPKITIVKVS